MPDALKLLTSILFKIYQNKVAQPNPEFKSEIDLIGKLLRKSLVHLKSLDLISIFKRSKIFNQIPCQVTKLECISLL